MVEIRPARAEDHRVIRRMVFAEQLDPSSLDWRHFLVAEEGDKIVGIGQVKEYSNCQELGSLVVVKEYRGRGIAAQLITALESRAGRPLYLLCEAKMGSYYAGFGYQEIGWRAAPGR